VPSTAQSGHHGLNLVGRAFIVTPDKVASVYKYLTAMSSSKCPILSALSTTPHRRRRDVLHISELAALIGYNQYQSTEETQAKIFKRLRPTSYRKAVERTHAHVQTDEQVTSQLCIDLSSIIDNVCEQSATAQVERILHKTPLVHASQAIIDKVHTMLEKNDVLPEKKVSHLVSVIEAPGKKLTDVAKIKLVKKASQLVSQAESKRKPVTQESITEFIREVKVSDCQVSAASVKSVVNKQRGTKNEPSAIEMYEAKTGTTVEDNNARFYMRNLGDDGNPCYIGGYVDGLAKNKVIEVKCRRNQFFRWLPKYEKVQIMAYMHVVGRTECDLVQKYGGEISVSAHAFEPEYWNRVVENVKQMWVELVAIFVDEDAQDELLQTVTM
jgi:hypothetical protein